MYGRGRYSIQFKGWFYPNRAQPSVAAAEQIIQAEVASQLGLIQALGFLLRGAQHDTLAR